jgi:hypothetical protein
LPPATLEIVARNHKDALIVSVAIEEYGTKPKKVGRRQAVVFEYDALLLMFKKPTNGVAYGLAAPEILGSVASLYPTGPMDAVFGNSPHLIDTLLFTFASGPCPIARNVQARRASITDPLPNLGGGFGAIEYQKQDGYIFRGHDFGVFVNRFKIRCLFLSHISEISGDS